MRARPALRLLGILSLAALSVWLADFLSLPEIGGTRPSPSHPDYVLEDFTTETYTAEGALNYVLHGHQLRHFTDDNTTKVDAPRLTLYRGEGPPWEADAEHGRVQHAEGRVDLLGRVHMSRAGTDGRPPLRLVTRDLTLYPERDYAQTAAPVQIERGQDRIDAVGMQAYLAEGRVELLENVIGRYTTD